MATADTKLGGSEESSLDSVRRSEESKLSSWESELPSLQHSLKFVLELKEEFVCPICRGVVLNPQQNSCGHIFCLLCLQRLLESSSPSSPVCPVDAAVITPSEVFQDNCCKREIACLDVYCMNSPECTSVVTLRHLQEHLRSCQFETLQCCNPGCRAALQRRELQDHLSLTCAHRLELCTHCQQPQRLSLLQVQSSPHRVGSCAELLSSGGGGLSYSCSLKVPRHMLTEHRDSCPELHVDCSYQRLGCSVQGKRGRVKLHEDSAVSQHMLLVLRSNTHLEQQETALLRHNELQTDSLLLAGLQKKIRPLLQHNSSQEHIVSAAQRTLSRQEDVLSTLQLDVQQISRGLGSGLQELEDLRKSLDAENMKRNSGLLDIHATQLRTHREHLQELEATSHDGKLIWKIEDFRNKREAEVKGHPPCLSSVPFHTGPCGYKMASKVYLNGDGEGRGTHLSLYVVLMVGDFDALLPWPFRQTVALSVLDQSGAGNHQSLSFKPDLTSKSFQRPTDETAGNVAVGFSCFIPLIKLEKPPNAAYVKEDTMFVKVKVDMAGLEQL
ncbi:hypothetical protein F7725_005986 [Dissostichus mawsoni]|uniref:TNF receptor-associated factor n=1 Tax=Dissostichus mawsoni TaxID=36200 RepID=A0A7J5YUX9_DISMA|nr:hypothetical protein F7725_005986 [Dissostichus mawsoni]